VKAASCLTCEDWRALSPTEIGPLIDAEAAAYRRELWWDVTGPWQPVEPARLAGALPGFVVRDDQGRVRGWTCFLDHHGVRQVAMLVSDSEAVTAALVEGVVTAPGATESRGALVCVRDAAPGLVRTLRERRFDVGLYRYLVTSPLTVPVARSSSARSWCPGDLEPVAELCARAYAESTDVRAFAPGGTRDEWLEYITTLVTGTGCGTFMPDASYLVPGDVPGELDAAVLATDLGYGTTHIAQLVVDPGARGRGLGRQLVDAVVRQAHADRRARVTLLVAESNRPAGRLYDAAGFTDRAQHVVAVRVRGTRA
jgi:ribosomal protein S18 acetylase RimI-like enzyme